jgi:hypothetical protein
MTIKLTTSSEKRGRGSRLLVIGGLLVAFAACSSCLLPVALLSAGITGGLLSNFAHAPYSSISLATTTTLVVVGVWLLYRRSKRACIDACTKASESSPR